MTFRNTNRSLLPRTSVLTLALLGAAASALGCDSRAGEEYQGEPLMTISGSVVVNNDLAPAELVPALAFYAASGTKTDLWIHDVSVTGEFPASFTLDVFEPPPAEALFAPEDGVGPKVALGFIAAVSPDHPETVEIPSGGGSASCSPITEGQPELGEICIETHEYCIDDQRQCYVETTQCDVRYEGETRIQDCRVIEASGDPELGRSLWKHFAGVSTRYMVVYLDGPAEPVGPLARAFPGRYSLGAGYHLLEMRPFSPAELDANRACREQANADALALYNQEHGTAYADRLDIPEEIWDQVNEEIETTEDELENERGCKSGSSAMTLIPPAAAHDLTIAIGPDVEPPSLF